MMHSQPLFSSSENMWEKGATVECHTLLIVSFFSPITLRPLDETRQDSDTAGPNTEANYPVEYFVKTVQSSELVEAKLY